MKRARKNRLVGIGAASAGVAVAVTLALRAFEENLSYFFSPTQIVEGEAPAARDFRIGGMVVVDSLEREPGSLTVRFKVTDFVNTVPVSYTGVLPDLFGEDLGVVARGRLDGSGGILASEVLARHDENYMPVDLASPDR